MLRLSEHFFGIPVEQKEDGQESIGRRRIGDTYLTPLFQICLPGILL
jgi:hypothetical protein